tara:strand:- start:1595 stop:2050 length:456 start_codon:yes stop_codon:yes gene_type:complete
MTEPPVWHGDFNTIHSSFTAGKDCQIKNFCDIGPDCTFGDRVLLESYVRLGSNCTLGDDVTLKQGVICTKDMVFGDGVFVGPQTTFLRSDHRGDAKTGTTLGAKAFIGANCVIMPGITIGPGVVVGALSFVNRDLLEPGVYMGRPARRRGA